MPSDGSRPPRRAPSGRAPARSGSGSGRSTGGGTRGSGAGKGRPDSPGRRPAARSSSPRTGGAAGGTRGTGRSGASRSGVRDQGSGSGRGGATSRSASARTSGRPADRSGRPDSRRDTSERPASRGGSATERGRTGSGTRSPGRTGGGATAGRTTGGRPGSGASRGRPPARTSGTGARPDAPRTRDRDRDWDSDRPRTRTTTSSSVRDAAERRRPNEEGSAPLPRGAKKWGNVARRGAREVTAQSAPEGGQRNTYFVDERTRRKDAPPPRRQAGWVRADGARKEWEDTEPLPSKAGGRGRAKRATGGDGVTSGSTKSGNGGAAGSAGAALAALSGKRTLPADVATEIRNAADVATAAHRERLVERAESAFGAFERGRFQDALRAIKPVADEAPSVPDVRELAGLAAYRVGRWREAVRHLQAFGLLGDSTEHLPILMDCQRALHKPKKVAELWTELRQRSPEPDVLAEGRIVAAASLADGGDLSGAIAMLSTAGATKALRNPSARQHPPVVPAGRPLRAGGRRAPGPRVLRTGGPGRSGRLRRGRPAARPRTPSAAPARRRGPRARRSWPSRLRRRPPRPQRRRQPDRPEAAGLRCPSGRGRQRRHGRRRRRGRGRRHCRRGRSRRWRQGWRSRRSRRRG